MEELTSFSLRIPTALARSIEAEAKRSGLSKSEYARRALEDFNQRVMQERITEISRRLASQSAGAAQSMEPSTSDELV
jgi:predicted transcriptional regulator